MYRLIDLNHIFTHESLKYHELVSKEDYQDNLMNTIFCITNLNDADILELGAGTGRLTFKLCKYANTVHAFDKSKEMLLTAEKIKKELRIDNCEFKQASSDQLPPFPIQYDLAISGWSFVFAVLSSSNNFNKSLLDEMATKILKQMNQCIKHKGMLIIIETLGTCKETPDVPDTLLNIYKYIEDRYQFRRKEIRTDFKFKSIEEAVELMTFFFGNKCEEYIISRNSLIIPECTGIWYRGKSKKL